MGFIEEISVYVQKYAPQYGIKVCSPILAQAVLESASGTSELAINAHNYFGLKYRNGRCPTSCGIYQKTGNEQSTDGSYAAPQLMQWMKFPDMESGVRGYFDFTNIAAYSNLKGVTDPMIYLENIKKDGYATSVSYVQNLMNVIKKYNLIQYDTKGSKKIMGYSNSPLVNYTKISPNKTSPRNHAIDTITIHCMAGNLSVETCGNVFYPASRNASSNYGVGSDGRIGLYVEEKDRSWCSSNSANDNRAVTIEVANDGGAPDWHVSDKAMSSLINLIADICKRNNIKELKWEADKSLIGQVNRQNMTVHRWFAATACPGNYLYGKQAYIAEEVNKKLGVNKQTNDTSSSASVSTKSLYRVRKSWSDAASQIGAYSSLENAKKACKNGYYVFDVKGNVVYPIPSNTSSTSNTNVYQVKLLDDLNIRKTPNGTIVKVNGARKGVIYTIIETHGNWGRLKSGAGWICVSDKYVKRV